MVGAHWVLRSGVPHLNVATTDVLGQTLGDAGAWRERRTVDWVLLVAEYARADVGILHTSISAVGDVHRRTLPHFLDTK